MIKTPTKIALFVSISLMLSFLCGCRADVSDPGTNNGSNTRTEMTSAPHSAAGNEGTAQTDIAGTEPAEEQLNNLSHYLDSIPDELKQGQWIAEIPNYGGTGEEHYLRILFLELSAVSVDLLRVDPAHASMDDILYSYTGDLYAFSGRLSMDLELDMSGDEVAPRKKIAANYVVQYPERGPINRLTLSEPDEDLLLTEDEFQETTLILTQQPTEGLGFLNPTMIRTWMWNVPEILDRAVPAPSDHRGTQLLHRTGR